MRIAPLLAAFVLLLTGPTSPGIAQDGFEFRVRLDSSRHAEPVDGRLLLFLSSRSEPEPRFGPSIFDPEPVYGRDVTGWSLSRVQAFRAGAFQSPTARAFPRGLADLDPGTYRVQALLDTNTTRRSYSSGPGNLYSAVRTVEYDPSADRTVTLTLDRVAEAEERADTRWVEEFSVESSLLSEFHERTVRMRAGVILPSGYREEPDRRYPVVFVIPGFGGRHWSAWDWIQSPTGADWRSGDWPIPMVRVVLDPDVPLGHSTFANSANVGPVGDALVEEFIPALEEAYRVARTPRGRFLRGHSSGGWASLYLQIEYPEFFGGAWSTAPDPVDFRAFETVNVYEDADAYYDRDGHPRPSIRENGEIVLSIRDENRIEYVTGPGGQWGSWFAVFGPRGEDGRPQPLWEPLTGRIDREVARYWRRFDLRRRLETGWDTLAAPLEGKLHVVGGAEDNFYLERGLRMMKEFLETTDYGGYVRIRPGNHGSFLTPDLRRRFYREMARTYSTDRP